MGDRIVIAVTEPHPHLRILGVPVRVEWSFWLIAVFLGFGAREGWLLVAWVAIVLVSVLVHELGHAFALRAFHQQPRVVLHAFGGLTYGSSAYRSRAQSIIVSAAGPVSAFVVLGVPAYLYLQSFDLLDQFLRHDQYVIVHDIAYVNIAWSIVNLLPILPLDGGNIAQSLFGRAAARILSMGVAFAAATYFFQQDNQFAGFFLMMFAIMNFASFQQERAGSDPTVPTPQPTKFHTIPAPRGAQEAAKVLGGADPFVVGARLLTEGKTPQGLDTLVKAYTTRPSGPTNLATAQQVARAGQAAALATRLLAAGRNGPQAAAGLQSHLHYADCFRDSADVGALVYADGRSNRAQTAFEVGCALARTGDNDSAMAWIRTAIGDGFRAGSLLDGEPDLATLRLRPDWPELRALANP